MSIHLYLFLGFILLLCVAVILAVMGKFGFFKCFFFSLLSGVGALLALHFTSLMSGVSLALNWVSLSVSALGGIPAVVGMLMLEKFIF